jgi:hypothetical protein
MRRNNVGLFSLFLVGGYYLWRNRFQLTRVLESIGINVPLSTRNIPDTLRSGVAKITGKVEHASDHLERRTG